MDNNSEIGDLVNQTQYVNLPPPDALREFTVQTSNYSAEFGHSAGAVLNIYDEVRHQAVCTAICGSSCATTTSMQRTTSFSLRSGKPEFRLNQFGGTLGGPIVIPHIYNGQRSHVLLRGLPGLPPGARADLYETVPTLAEQNSGFTNMQDLITLQTGTTTDALGRTFPKGTVMDPVTTRAITKGVADPVTGLTATATGYVRDPFYTGS